jgi:ABC-2 type transport system permease protein
MRAATTVEWWKLRRSRVVLTATVLMALFLPLMGLGFYTVATTGGSGAMAEKAAAMLVGEGWPAFFGLVDQIAAVAVFIGAGVVVGWIFGREHIDRTFPALFSLPVKRGSVAIAKFVVAAAWITVLAVAITIVTLTLGWLSGVGPGTSGEILAGAVRLTLLSLGDGALALTLGLVASVGRGYLPAIGAMIVIVAVAQVAVLLGTGGWFPFAVPGLAAVAGSPGVPELNGLQVALVPVMTLAAIVLTVRWWRNAEVV